LIALQILILIAGFAALIKGADWFVDGSAALAKKFHVSGLIIGLTIVALGTSAPELAVSSIAAIEGSNEIAFSNVVGSNIFNLLCVLGMCAVIHQVPVEPGIIKRDFPLTVGATLLVVFGTFFRALTSGSWIHAAMHDTVGFIGRPLSLALLVLFIIYIVYLIIDARKHPTEEDEIVVPPAWKIALLILVGIALIVAGGQAVVYSAKEIARACGMTETLIGLTVISVGTSLPELVTSVVAARKGETELAIGNVLGSNIFNILMITGACGVIRPVTVNAACLWDMLILIAISVIVYVFARTGRKVDRKEGLVMLALYIAEMVFAILR